MSPSKVTQGFLQRYFKGTIIKTATRKLFVISGEAGKGWLPRIAAHDPDAVVFWLNTPDDALGADDSSLTVITDQQGRDSLLSKLVAMAKRGHAVVYVDQLMRSAQAILTTLEQEGIAAHALRDRIPDTGHGKQRKHGKASAGAIFLLVMLDMVGFSMLLPSLPFLNQQLGGSAKILGWIIAGFSIGQLIASPLFGALSDRIGRKPVLALSLVLSVVGNLMYAFSPSDLWLAISRFVAGFAAGNLSVARAYITEVTPAEKRTAAMGMIGAAFGIGFTIGPGIGAAIAGFGLRAPGYFAAALGLINLIYLWWSVAEPPHRGTAARGSAKGTIPWTPVLINILIYVVAIAGFAGFETVGALVTQASFGWGNFQNGILFAGAGILAALIQGGLVRPLSKKFDDRILLLAGYVLMTIGFAIIAHPALSLARFLFGSALVAGGLNLSQPSMFSLYSSLTGEHNRGALMGWLHAGGSLARIAGPIWAGAAFASGSAVGGANRVFGGTMILLGITTILVAAGWTKLVNNNWNNGNNGESR